MEKNISKHQRARIYEVEMLVRQGLKLQEVGSRLAPPVTPQRAWQLLKIGVDLGMFPDPRDRRKVQVQRLETPKREPRAKIDPEKRRAEKMTLLKQRVIEDYKAVSVRIGRNPTTADLGPSGLRARIYQHFGSFALFLEALGERPSYVKPSWKAREARRSEVTHNSVFADTAYILTTPSRTD